MSIRSKIISDALKLGIPAVAKAMANWRWAPVAAVGAGGAVGAATTATGLTVSCLVATGTAPVWVPIAVGATIGFGALALFRKILE